MKPKLNLPAMMGRRTTAVGQLTKGVEFLFKKNKVDWLKGEGRIAGPGKVEVTAADGVQDASGRQEHRHRHRLGADAAAGRRLDQKRVVDSTGALSLPEVPKKLIVVGAGIIGLELGSVWRRLGAKVTVVEFLDRITPGIDAEIAKAFQRGLTKQGISFKLGHEGHRREGRRPAASS